jgi:adenosine deaminase
MKMRRTGSEAMPVRFASLTAREGTAVEHMPKVELHLHLDCCLSYSAVHLLDPTVTPETYRREFIAPARCPSLADYLRYPPRSVALLQTKDALRLAVEDLFQQLRRDRVLYAEIRFAPFLHVERGLAPEAVVETVERSVESEIAATGIQARVILCTLRHFTAEQSMETARLVTGFAGSHVTAFDIAGDEAGYPLEPHVPAFRRVAEHGMSITAHAGEARGPESVWETLEKVRPARIGHGIRSIEDEGLVAHLVSHQVHLEVCPGSNLQTGVSPSLAAHPIDRLYRLGVPLGISTDTRTITDVTLNREYEGLVQTFDWTPAHFRKCNLDAAAAAFAPDPVKQAIQGGLLAGYRTPGG